MSFRGYAERKESGVEWLGKIPSHWGVVPLCAVGSERSELNRGMAEDNLLSLSFGRIVPKDISSNDGLLPESFETYQIVRPGDIVFRLTDLQNDKRSLRSAIVGETGIITSAYVAMSVAHDDPHYMSYLFRAYDVQKVFYSMGGGLRQSMKFCDMKRLPTLRPPLREQRLIATFLDRETGKIDALIEEQQRLIDLLKEKRQAVISKAVTRGLDSDVPMKDSGVEWLGQVPAHWNVIRLRFLCNIATGSFDTVDALDEGEFPFFVRSDTVERLDRYTHDCEAVLTSGDGAGVGKVFHHYIGKFAAHQRVYVFTNFRRVSGRFFYHYLAANFFKVALEGGAKSTVDSLRRPLIANFWMTVPPMDEQVEIDAHIGRLTLRYNNLILEVSDALSLLHERRSALISAAVTGKIDVRDAVTDTELAAA